ncbi:MAG: RyR domain-containing protein [Methylovirgula sp.]
MSDFPERSSKSTNLKIRLLVVCGLLAVLLIIIGLVSESLEFDHRPVAWYEIPSLLLLSFAEDGWFVGRHEGGLIIIGAMLARFTVLSAIILAGWAIFARQIHGFFLARRRRHVVVIGNTPTAREVVAYLESQGHKFIHVVETETEPAGSSFHSRIALPFTVAALERPVALREAKRIILDTGEIAGNMALARAIRHAFGDKAPPISCNIESTHLADEFGELLGVQRDVLIYDEARLSVRDILARHPLYASADRQAATRVHLMIIGFGRLGRVFLEEAIQDSIAGALEKPFVTIIDREAKTQALAFDRDKPQHQMAADIGFIACDVMDTTLDAAASPQRAALFARDDAAPVTAIALCLASDADNVAAAMALRALRRRSGRCFAPVFMHMRDAAGAGNVFLHADKDRIVDPFDSIIPIRLSREALAIDILAEGERDRMAKRIHASFRELSGDRQAANASWVALTETYRRASRHAADHIAAKLWSLGLATERHSTDSPFAVDAEWEQQLAARKDDLERLARLEHRRWIADRVMEGWTFSDRRDDDLRHQPDLVPFDDVSPQDQEKDRDQIARLRVFIKEAAREDGRRFMPELVVGLAAQPDIDRASIEAMRGEIDRRLAAPLADLTAHHVITIVSSLAPGVEFAAVEALVAALKERVKGDASEIRLLVPEGVPYPILLKQSFADPATREIQMHQCLDVRRKLFKAFSRVETVRIGTRGHSNDEIFREPALFDEGQRRANAYLARRADVLCVLWDGKAETEPGSIGELVAFRKGEHGIEAALDPGPSRSGAPRPTVGMERFIHIKVERGREK